MLVSSAYSTVKKIFRYFEYITHIRNKEKWPRERSLWYPTSDMANISKGTIINNILERSERQLLFHLGVVSQLPYALSVGYCEYKGYCDPPYQRLFLDRGTS